MQIGPIRLGHTLTEDEKLPMGSTTYIHEHLWSNVHNIPLTDLPGLDLDLFLLCVVVNCDFFFLIKSQY